MTASAKRTVQIMRATHLGMCFGVRDAIALALEHADAGPLTILGDLVHNPTVLGALEAKGIEVARDVADCARYCARVHHVQTDTDVRPQWFDGANVVGLTAGTSTPDDVLDRVQMRLRQVTESTG
jgi:4-hydroxy-3-methylbut-2-enyl diphosphate reductase IspH